MTTPEHDLPQALVDGYRRFRATRFAAEQARYRQLAEQGQRPSTVVIACSDSRTAPETVFDAGPGELFVVRNVGALVPAYEPDPHRHGVSAALEYAIMALDVHEIVVMGHGRCGGVAAALEEPDPLTPSDFVGTWVATLRDLAREIGADDAIRPADRQHRLELRSVERSMDNLRTFPWIRSRELDASLFIRGAWFDIGSGELHLRAADRWFAEADR